MSLKNKVALVTGGSRGIGAAIAKKLASDGADVAISYSASAEKAQAVVNEIKKMGCKAACFKANQAVPAEVEKMVDSVVKEFGQLDILVNNAGVFVTGLLGDPGNDQAAFIQQEAVNVGGVRAAVQAAIKVMKAGGRIINIGSVIASRFPGAGMADYGATKAAVAAYTRGWALDLGPKNITVNTVQPGPIDTDMNPDSGPMAEGMKQGIPLKRYGKPEEVAAAVAFLASPEASYITAATLNVDGGFAA